MEKRGFVEAASARKKPSFSQKEYHLFSNSLGTYALARDSRDISGPSFYYLK
jgi:hypothetical protein